jgi:hypothetical protein
VKRGEKRTGSDRLGDGNEDLARRLLSCIDGNDDSGTADVGGLDGLAGGAAHRRDAPDDGGRGIGGNDLRLRRKLSDGGSDV